MVFRYANDVRLNKIAKYAEQVNVLDFVETDKKSAQVPIAPLV